ncbi:MAG: V-type ATP synthase subunit F [Methanocellales archaeon]|nr:V-type ATP synthase subunit F [Methanocellales archaeon]
MKAAVIGDRNMTLGFSLAGVKKMRVAETPRETEEALKHFLVDPEIGIIMLLDSLAESIRPFMNKVQGRKEVYPIVVEVPGKEGSRAIDPINRLIRKAVGIDVERSEVK